VGVLAGEASVVFEVSTKAMNESISGAAILAGSASG